MKLHILAISLVLTALYNPQPVSANHVPTAIKDVVEGNIEIPKVPSWDLEVLEPLRQKQAEAAQEALQQAQQAQTVKNTPAAVSSPKTAPVASQDVWYRLATCESGQRWDYNGSSGYDGGLQFLPSTWTSLNMGYEYAWQAPAEIQIQAGIKLYRQLESRGRNGWASWPACSKKLNLPPI